EKLENGYHHAVRKSIKKAERAQVQVFNEGNLAHLEDFLSIYNATMNRNDAKPAYYFEPDFYRDFERQLPGRFRFFYAKWNDRVVSCEMVLIYGLYAHSYLGGTLAEALDVCPNHLLKREIIRYAKSAGCARYLLGGGTRPFDGIW